MSLVIVSEPNFHSRQERILHNMHCFRHEVFFKKLGWDVGSHNGLEIDDYDDCNPLYMVTVADNDGVTGCARLLPTTGRYMLKDTFPDLLRGEIAPVAHHIWEISRFAADSGQRIQAGACDITAKLLVSIVEYALENNISEYVAVISLAMERFVKSIGLPVHRLGDGKVTQIGLIRSVAIRFKVDHQLLGNLQALQNSVDMAA